MDGVGVITPGVGFHEKFAIHVHTPLRTVANIVVLEYTLCLRKQCSVKSYDLSYDGPIFTKIPHWQISKEYKYRF